MESNGKKIEIDVRLDRKTLDCFLIRNNYMRFGGIVGLLISFSALAGLIAFWQHFAVSQRVILLFLFLMFTVIQPFTLLLKGWEQLKKGCFRDPFHYGFSDEGVEVVNTAGTVQITWDQIWRAVVTRQAMYLYMNSVSAFIIPRKECEEYFDEIVKEVREHTK